MIKRTDRIPDTIPGISRFQQCVLHQGRIERFFLDSLKEYSNIEIERGVLPEELELDHSKSEDVNAYPIKVKVRHLDDEEATPVQNNTSVPDGLFRSSLAKDDTDDLIRKSRGKNGTTEIIRAKYMIGNSRALHRYQFSLRAHVLIVGIRMRWRSQLDSTTTRL